MNTTTLQIPISKTLKADATAVAREHGFSSLQEIVRVLLTKLAKRQLIVSVEELPIFLSLKAEKRYLQMDKDFKNRKNIHTARDIEDLVHQLRE